MSLAIMFLIMATGLSFIAANGLPKGMSGKWDSVMLLLLSSCSLSIGALLTWEAGSLSTSGAPVHAIYLAQPKPRHFKQVQMVACNKTPLTNYVILQELRLDPLTLKLRPVDNLSFVYTGDLEWLTDKFVTIWVNDSGALGIRPITNMPYDYEQ